MRVYELTHKVLAGNCTFSEDDLDTLLDEFKNANIGEVFEVKVSEMSKDDYDKLPEFEGW